MSDARFLDSADAWTAINSALWRAGINVDERERLHREIRSNLQSALSHSDGTLVGLIVARIRRLPESSATKSRDYGRGYAQAVRDVVEILEGLYP